MKKITSFICFIVLTALLAMSIPFITANAEETDPSKPDLQADDIEIMRGFESICGNEVESLIGEIKKDYLESIFDNYYKEHDTQTKEQWLNDHHASIKELYLLSDYVIAVYIRWDWEGIAELEYDETVAGYTFHFHNMKSYLIWNDHKFFSLKEAYEQGIISKSNIGELYEYSPYKSPVPDIHRFELPLDKETESRIKNDYIYYFLNVKAHGRNYDLSENDVKLSLCIGGFNGAYVLDICLYGEFFDYAIYKETVAGVEFTYQSSKFYLVWKDGEFKRITGAYECGWIDDGDMKIIEYLTANSRFVGEAGSPTLLSGDANKDGIIDATDYLIVKRHILGISKLSNIFYADADRNGRLDITDYITIKRIILGIGANA